MIETILVPIKHFYAKARFNLHDQLRNVLLEQIEQTPDDGTNPNITKVDWAYGLNSDREWYKTIKPHIEFYMNEMGKPAWYKEATVHDLWVQQYTKNDVHTWHVHGQQFVGVYYLEFDATTPKTQFVEPISGNIYTIDVTEGDIIIFPSSLIHRAPVMQSDSRKTIISWNFNYDKPMAE